jgi:hypothetical protein
MQIVSKMPKISHLVFLFSFLITTLSIIPALFPALYSSFYRTSPIPIIPQFNSEIYLNQGYFSFQ